MSREWMPHGLCLRGLIGGIISMMDDVCATIKTVARFLIHF